MYKPMAAFSRESAY